MLWGAHLFLAERLGSERLVGVELDAEHYEATLKLTRLLQSQVILRNCDFLDFDAGDYFDHVYILNVTPHVNDYYRFIQKAAQIALKTLTIEFQTLSDNRFARFHKLRQEEPANLNKLPLIGVSSNKSAGQGFVFSPEAMRHLVLDEIGGFDRYEIKEIAIMERVVMKFSRRL